MGSRTPSKRIDEISMMKGIGIMVVVAGHMATIAGFHSNIVSHTSSFTPVETPVMAIFILLSGYLTSPWKNTIGASLKKRTKSLLLPYYKFSIFALICYAIIYLIVERKSFAWYADGAMGLLLQLQSIHIFDPATTGVHPMFYAGLIAWFLFQMAVSSFVYIPLLHLIREKKPYWKLLLAALLIAAGAVLYVLNLQGLNGQLYPPVCKAFVLPNIPGIAGLLLLGNFLADIKFLDFSQYSGLRIVLTMVISFAALVVMYMTDDRIYAFPTGKWGTFGPMGYLTATLYGIAMTVILGLICYFIKRLSGLKDVLVLLGDHSMDVLITHYFFGFLIAYIGGFWYDILTESPSGSTTGHVIHLIILVVAVPVGCYFYIKGKIAWTERKKNKKQS